MRKDVRFSMLVQFYIKKIVGAVTFYLNTEADLLLTCLNVVI